MKTKEEVEKWMRDEISNPIIGKMIMDMTEAGVPYDAIMKMAKILIDNTPNVEKQLVEDYMRDERIEQGDIILADLEADLDKFNKIREKNGFSTVWSLYEIKALSLKSPFKGKWMNNGINGNIKIELPNRKLTGLELWKYADELYNKLGAPDHIFLENFVQNGDVIEAHFGS